MRKRFLNVGGGDKNVPVPSHYAEWDHLLLDIDPDVGPDVCLDARELAALEQGQFDAIYCSHNLEHYFAHDVPKVLDGFHKVLKPDGFAEIRVPDIGLLMKIIAEHNLDIDDVLYHSGRGPIMVKDILYGHGAQIAQSGVDFYAHKTGFTQKSLARALQAANFETIAFTAGRYLEIVAFAFKDQLTQAQWESFKERIGEIRYSYT